MSNRRQLTIFVLVLLFIFICIVVGVCLAASSKTLTVKPEDSLCEGRFTGSGVWADYVINCAKRSETVTCSYTYQGTPGNLPIVVKSAVPGKLIFPPTAGTSSSDYTLQVIMNCSSSSLSIKDDDYPTALDFILLPNEIVRERVDGAGVVRSRTISIL